VVADPREPRARTRARAESTRPERADDAADRLAPAAFAIDALISIWLARARSFGRGRDLGRRSGARDIATVKDDPTLPERCRSRASMLGFGLGRKERTEQGGEQE